MSSKQSTAEEEKEESAEYSDLFLQKGNAKRVRLASLREKTLQDLPIELLEDILIKTIVMEVKSLKMAKSVWKVKADPVMRRLGTVCSQWSDILTTNYFRKRLYGVLEDTAQDPILLERLELPGPRVLVDSATTLKDEVFVMWRKDFRDFIINVYDRNSLEKEKDVISLPDIKPLSLVASSVSNCLYILNTKGSVQRICRDENQQFNISALISNVWLPSPTLSVTATGDLILSRQRKDERVLMSIYSATGCLQHELRLSTEISCICQIIAKSNGNLVLESLEIGQNKRRLTEIDLQGTILRRYLSSVYFGPFVCNADINGRMLVFDGTPRRLVLLDSEFNTLKFTGPRIVECHRIFPNGLRYDGERNEMISISGRNPVIICRLTDGYT